MHVRLSDVRTLNASMHVLNTYVDLTVLIVGMNF